MHSLGEQIGDSPDSPKQVLPRVSSADLTMPVSNCHVNAPKRKRCRGKLICRNADHGVEKYK